jgi:hypothetical protein
LLLESRKVPIGTIPGIVDDPLDRVFKLPLEWQEVSVDIGLDGCGGERYLSCSMIAGEDMSGLSFWK